jgi:glycosyltransferase involved in cell wall biosynthesis
MARRDDVTVVIPCFNHGDFLGEAVASAQSQEGEGRLRLIVVDDGSTEIATADALEALPPEVEVVSQANGGPAAARNAGFALAETDYVIPLDADDRLAPGALLALRAALEADAEAAHAYGVMRYFGDWNGEVRFPGYDPYRLLYRPIVGWTGMVRRSAWEATGRFDPHLPGYEDWDFQLGALGLGLHGRRVDQVVLEYRKHGQSSLAAHRGRHRDIYRRLRAKHEGLYSRAGEFAAETDLGLFGRALYRTYWAWRPIPASWERAVYGLFFRG